MTGNTFETLEGRWLFAAAPKPAPKPMAFPLTVYNGALVGEFTSNLPFVVTSGDSDKVSLKLTNRSKVRQYGTIDISFVLTKGSASASKFSPTLGEVRNYVVDLKPKQSTTVAKTVIWNETVKSGDYTVTAAVDPGGFIALGKAFGSSVPGATVFLQQAKSDLFVSNFNVRSTIDPKTKRTVLTFVITILNGGTAFARGTVPVTIYAAQFNQKDPGDIALKTVTQKLALRPKTSTTLTVTVPVPDDTTVPAGNYFLRIDLDTTQVLAEGTRRNDTVFSNKAIALNGGDTGIG